MVFSSRLRLCLMEISHLSSRGLTIDRGHNVRWKLYTSSSTKNLRSETYVKIISSNIEMFEIHAMFVIKQNIRHKDHMTPKTWVLNFVLFMFYMAGMTAKNPWTLKRKEKEKTEFTEKKEPLDSLHSLWQKLHYCLRNAKPRGEQFCFYFFLWLC